jgi:hypothetical protein
MGDCLPSALGSALPIANGDFLAVADRRVLGADQATAALLHHEASRRYSCIVPRRSAQRP